MKYCIVISLNREKLQESIVRSKLQKSVEERVLENKEMAEKKEFKTMSDAVSEGIVFLKLIRKIEVGGIPIPCSFQIKKCVDREIIDEERRLVKYFVEGTPVKGVMRILHQEGCGRLKNSAEFIGFYCAVEDAKAGIEEAYGVWDIPMIVLPCPLCCKTNGDSER